MFTSSQFKKIHEFESYNNNNNNNDDDDDDDTPRSAKIRRYFLPCLFIRDDVSRELA